MASQLQAILLRPTLIPELTVQPTRRDVCPVLGDLLSAPTFTLSIWSLRLWKSNCTFRNSSSITSLPFFVWKTLVATAIQVWADEWSNLRSIVNDADSFWRTLQTSSPERIMVLNGSILPEYQQIRSLLRLWRIVWVCKHPDHVSRWAWVHLASSVLGIRQRVPTLRAASSLRWIILSTVWVGRFSNLAAWRGLRNEVGSDWFSMDSSARPALNNNLSTFVDKFKAYED